MFRRSDFRKLELFGGGKKNTKVFKVEYIRTGQIFALKEVEAKNLDKLNEYKEEAVQLSKAQHHPNILQCYGYYFYSTPHNTVKLGIISEFINREFNLETIYRRREKQRLYWKEDKLLKIAYYLIDTFAYLEHIGICHRDIKPTNLFLLDTYEIKVIDFGESIEFFDDDEEQGQMATIRGTPQYLSPILWQAHVILKAKEAEHNMFKSDVFSTGLVLYQLAAMRDVSGFNQKTEQCDGEKLIRDGLKYLSKSFSNKLVEIIRRMLIFDENERPTFIQLAKFIAGNDYTPRVDKSLIAQMEENFHKKSASSSFSSGLPNSASYIGSNNSNSTNMISNMNMNNNQQTDLSKSSSEKSASALMNNKHEENLLKFNTYITKNKIKINNNIKSTMWFEYGGCLMAKYQIKSTDDNTTKTDSSKTQANSNSIPHSSSNTNNKNTKWKLIRKNHFNFPYHFEIVYIDETYGYFLIGGHENDNTFQYKDDNIYIKAPMSVQRSFMSVVNINHLIFAIGGYDTSEKTHLSSIEVYDIQKNKWSRNVIKDLNVPRSQAGAVVLNNRSIFVFGGYSKSFGTLNSIEHILPETKECELLNIELPVAIRRFGVLKVSESKVLLMGGISKLSKKNEDSFIVDVVSGHIEKGNELPQGGVLEHEIIVDDNGKVHLFFENNYGTSPPEHVAVNFWDLVKI